MSQVTIVCGILAALLAYVPHILKVSLVHKLMPKGNRWGKYIVAPRAALESVSGIKKDDSDSPDLMQRAQAAHLNQLEGLSIFYAAVLFALYANVPSAIVTLGAVSYVLGRIAYIYFYLTGTVAWKGYARSLTWFFCITVCLLLMIAACIYAA